MPSLQWEGGPLATTADGASWSLIGKQLGWSLFGQTVGVIVCGARRAAAQLRVCSNADEARPAVLLRGPWKRCAPRSLFRTMTDSSAKARGQRCRRDSLLPADARPPTRA
jgi:hypothetical protein